ITFWGFYRRMSSYEIVAKKRMGGTDTQTNPKSPTSSVSELAEVSQLVRAAKLDAEAIRNAADADARALSRRARKQVAARRAREWLLAADRFRRSLIEQAETAVAVAVTEIATEVVGAALREQPEAIASRIRRALRYRLHESPVVVLVHPTEVSVCAERLAGDGASVEVRGDPSLSGGEARIVVGGAALELSPKRHLSALLERVTSRTAR
ncbi:MAG: hypothetical protein KDD44_07855, partial [Bdellovibrionales bacterium]|nr:hypothetical protein [Bdellovibrionales bacterium]